LMIFPVRGATTAASETSALKGLKAYYIKHFPSEINQIKD